MSHVYVLVEHDADNLLPVTGELITAARELGTVSAVVVGKQADKFDADLAALGAAQVVQATAEDYDQRFLTPEVDALHALGAANPAPIVLAATPANNEIAGRLAARLASGALVNVNGIAADGSARMSIFGGSYETTSTAAGQCPIYTLRPGAVEAAPQQVEAQPAPMPLPAATGKDVKVTSFTPAQKSARPEITEAKAVVAGGRGVGNEFGAVVEPLADALGAAVGATRDAVDEGFMTPPIRSARPVLPSRPTSTSAWVSLALSSTPLACRLPAPLWWSTKTRMSRSSRSLISASWATCMKSHQP